MSTAMLPKERVAAAFRHEPTDRVPIYQAGFSSRAASFVLGREAYEGGGIQQYREACALWAGGTAHDEYVRRSLDDACELCEKLDLDLVRTGYWRKNERPTRRIDENTFEYAGGETWRFDPPTETYGSVAGSALAGPPPDLRAQAEREMREAEAYAPTESDFATERQALERFGARRAVPAGGNGIAVPRDAWWLEATILAPELVGMVLDAQALGAAKCVKVLAGMGLPYCMGGGDFAGAAGPFYAPAFFRSAMVPRLRRISDACHAVGAYHLFASDGDLWPVADDLFGRSGVDGYYEVDGSFMPLRRLRGKFPRLTLLGGIRSETLHLGTEEQVRQETRAAVETAKEIRGCIIGCSNQIVSPTPERSFWAMMETLERYRSV
jgi:hypothetical protein